jgi:hypothetical protein
MKKSNPLKLHFILFLVLSVVALAQLSWWVIFQVQEGGRLSLQQRAVWDQQISMALTYFKYVNPEDSEKSTWLTANFPDLLLDSATGKLTVSPGALQRLNRLAQKRVRMFVSEGAFFSLLVLTGIWFLFWALRKRIELENKTAAILSAASSGMKSPITGIRNDIDAIINSSQLDASGKELIEKISSNVQKIADTCEGVSLIQMLGASKRKIELEMIDVSQTTKSVVAGYAAAHSKTASRIDSKIEDGLTAVTNTLQWSRIVQGILRIIDDAAPSKDTINIDFSKNHVMGILDVNWKSGLADKDIEIILRDMEAESGIIRELGETIGVRIKVFVENGNSVSITAELPLLEE